MDSIVKNVGTPYTLYFGRNLFKIFMESYAVSDHAIRKRMEEMLKTWKEPVAGSMDMRPVFSAELVRPIENALMKVRAATMPPQGQLPGRPRSAMLPHRDTPTPPGMRGPGVPPPGTHTPQPYQQYPNGSQPGQPMPSQSPYPPQQQVSWRNTHLFRAHTDMPRLRSINPRGIPKVATQPLHLRPSWQHMAYEALLLQLG